jgi:ATP-binding cassette subfamily B protein
MARRDEKQRDKQVVRYIHRLFWRAMLQRRVDFALAAVLHIPFFFINSTYIPLQIAYGLQAIINHRFDQVQGHAIAVAVASVIGVACFSVATWAFNRMGVAAQKYVQEQVFLNYLQKDYEFFTNTYVGALGAQAVSMRDAIGVYDLTMLFNIPRYLTVIVAGLVVITINSWWLALVTVGCIGIAFSFSIMASKYRLRYRRELSEAGSELAGVVGDALSHGVNVKSFSNEQYELQRLHKAMTPWGNVLTKTWNLAIPQNGGRSILMALTAVVLLLVSSSMYRSGTISVAIVALIQLYVMRLMTTAVEISDTIKVYDGMIASAYKAAATMLVKSTVNDPASPKALSEKRLDISLRDVQYVYDEAKEGQEAISGFSLDVKSGEKIGVVGYSGSGKSTLTKLLLRFMDVTSGSIKLGGIDIRDVRQAELRQVVSYVPQEPLLFHRSVRENIAYARPDASQKDIEKVVKMAYVDEFVDELPQGYDTLVGERGIKLSGGQRQRVAIARAFLKDAPILVMDEATSALDSQSEVLIQEALWKLMKNRTAIVVAHRLSTIQKMDRIVVMDKGKIVDIGTHKQLLGRDGIYAQLWAHQSGGYVGSNNKETEE